MAKIDDGKYFLHDKLGCFLHVKSKILSRAINIARTYSTPVMINQLQVKTFITIFYYNPGTIDLSGTKMRCCIQGLKHNTINQKKN